MAVKRKLKIQRAFFLVIVFAVFTGPISAESSPAIWSNLPDNDLHTLAGISICFFVAGIAGGYDMTPVRITAISLSAAVLSGVVKELVDLAGPGNPEIMDIINTAVGGASAAIGILYAGYMFTIDMQPSVNSTALFVPMGIVLSIPVIKALWKR